MGASFSKEFDALLGKRNYGKKHLHCTLIKKKNKFSLFIRKFSMEQLQSHI